MRQIQSIGENTTNIPAFLGKLWKMVNDPATDHLISWSSGGNSFIIQNQAQFWYELLPLYYKHNNMSSFIRQLNMYGFHKISTVDNGSMDADKDEIQFFHPYFQKDQPELLKDIKRKVTGSRLTHDNSQLTTKNTDDLQRVLSDVTDLIGRQSSVDSQLSDMKHENALLWKQIALLRQKHAKQQLVVNKLLNFIISVMGPNAASKFGITGMKRPLMIHASPNKRIKQRQQSESQSSQDGLTIHELDSDFEVSTDELLQSDVTDEQLPLISSPLTPAGFSTSSSSSSNSGNGSVTSTLESGLIDDVSQDSSTVDPDDLWDTPEYIDITNVDTSTLPADDILTGLQPSSNEKVFLNPAARDALLSNLIGQDRREFKASAPSNSRKNGKTNIKKIAQQKDNVLSPTGDRTVAPTNKNVQINSISRLSDVNVHSTNGCSRDDLGLHLDNTQNELDQFKDVLNGCNSFDATTLLGLFNDSPNYHLSQYQNDNSSGETGDPMVSGNEMAVCPSNLIDFNELFDDTIDGHDTKLAAQSSPASSLNIPQSTLNTPLNVKNEPLFPSFS